MKILSFNVNGLRSVLSKNVNGQKIAPIGAEKNVLESIIDDHDPDVLCLQESRCPGDHDAKLPGFAFQKIFASSTKKGYSGVAVFSKTEPIAVHTDFQENEEGRVMTLEFPSIYLINAYCPNSKSDLSRLNYRINIWEKKMRQYINKLQEKKPVIYVGDLNVAHTQLDIYSVKGHNQSHGYTVEERGAFAAILSDCEMIDSFRYHRGNERKYSWFSNFASSRDKNNGWRIDYCLVSQSISHKIKNADILEKYHGSDHLCTLLEIDI